MPKDDSLSMLKREFDIWGVKLSTSPRSTGHIELSWQASPDKQTRTYIIAKTPSDARGWLNARADIRRLFRADGLTLKEPAKVTVLHRALSLPVHVQSGLPDQVKALQDEVADLTELILDLSGTLTMVRDYIISLPVKRKRRTQQEMKRDRENGKEADPHQLEVDSR